MNRITAVKKCGLIQKVVREGLRQLDGRGPGRVLHGRTDCWIRAVAPQWRVIDLIYRVMKIVTHQL